MRTVFLLFFSLLGVFSYFRMIGKPVLGFVIFVLPGCLAMIFMPLPQPMLSVRAARPLLLLKQKHSHQIAHAVSLLMYLVIVLLGFARSIAVGTRDFTVGVAELSIVFFTTLFFYLLVAGARQNGSYPSILRDLKNSLFLLMIMNVIAVLVGLRNLGIEAQYTRSISAVFGLLDYSVLFPFTNSGRFLSICAGVLVIIGIMDLSANKRWGDYFANCVMIGAGLAILLGHGSRVVLLGLLGVSLISLAWKPIARRLCYWMVLVLIFIPVIYTYSDIGSAVEDSANKSGLSLSRYAGEIATLSNRDAIWGSVFDEFSSFKWEHLWGYGAHGNITSGLSVQYATFFEGSYSQSSDMPVHNTFLQILVDYGYIGLSLFICILFSLLALLRKPVRLKAGIYINQQHEKTLTLILIYIVILSVTETCVTYFSLEIWSLFVFINIYAILSPQKIVSGISGSDNSIAKV